MFTHDRRRLWQRMRPHRDSDDLLLGLRAFWNCNGFSITSSTVSDVGGVTLSTGGSIAGLPTGGRIAGRIYKNEGDTGYWYDAAATLAGLARFTYTGWVSLPGLYVPMVGTYRNPTWLGVQDYIAWRTRMMYSIADGGSVINLTGWWRDGTGADKDTTIASGIDLSESTAEFAGWHFLYTKFDGTDLTYGVRTSSDHYSKTVTPTDGLPALGANADYFPWYPRPNMGSTTTGGDAFGVWDRALSTPLLDRLWNAGAGLQYPFG